MKDAQESRVEVSVTFNEITRYICRLVSHYSSCGMQYKHTTRNSYLLAMHEPLQWSKKPEYTSRRRGIQLYCRKAPIAVGIGVCRLTETAVEIE